MIATIAKLFVCVWRVKCRFLVEAVTIVERDGGGETQEATDTAHYSHAQHKELRAVYIRTQ